MVPWKRLEGKQCGCEPIYRALGAHLEPAESATSSPDQLVHPAEGDLRESSQSVAIIVHVSPVARLSVIGFNLLLLADAMNKLNSKGAPADRQAVHFGGEGLKWCCRELLSERLAESIGE